MAFEKLIAFIINRRVKKLRKKLTNANQDYIKKQLKKLNPRTLELIRKHFTIDTLIHAAENSPYYKKILPPLIEGVNYKNADAILKKLPLTSSVELSEKNNLFLAVPKSDVTSIHFTYGTTGGKKTVYNSKRDMWIINYSYALGFLLCNIDSSDVAQICYSYGVWALAGNIQRALLNKDIIALPVGNYVKFEEHKEFIEKFGTSVLFGSPSYIYNLAREIELSEDSKKKMKVIMVGGEGLPEHRRKVIEERLGGEVFINYGLNEVGGGIGSECRCHNGYHIYTNYIIEIINPESGEPVEKGEYGELVVTTIKREAMPLIRYRTGDITREIVGECECGLKLPRIDYLKGRADDRIVIGSAEKYYPITFDLLFDAIPEVKDYWIEVVTKDERDHLKTFVLTDSPSDELKEKIIEQYHSVDSIKIDIETTKTVAKPEIIFVDKVPKGTKRRRLIDKRKFLN
jgi:phenylacetate-CoA ligase